MSVEPEKPAAVVGPAASNTVSLTTKASKDGSLSAGEKDVSDDSSAQDEGALPAVQSYARCTTDHCIGSVDIEPKLVRIYSF